MRDLCMINQKKTLYEIKQKFLLTNGRYIDGFTKKKMIFNLRNDILACLKSATARRYIVRLDTKEQLF